MADFRDAIFIAFLAVSLATVCFAADPPPVTPPAAREVVVAKVGGDLVYESDVERLLHEALHGRAVSPEATPLLQAEMLDRAVDRRLVVAYLAKGDLAASKEEIDQFIADLRGKLQRQGSTLEEFLAKAKLDDAMFRHELAWQLGWEKYLHKNISDEAIAAYFKAHPRDFDGSEVRASHILFRPAGALDQAAIEKLVAQAKSVRAQIEASPSPATTFAEAAKKYSAGPSRAEGGDVGFFPRHGVMLEPFSAAAFALQRGQISEPVITTFGVHLILLTDVREGKKTWADVKSQLMIPLAQELFEQIAAQQRPLTKVEYTAAMPHFKPGTKKLVVGDGIAN